MLRYQTRSCTGLAVRALRKNKIAEDQRDDENPKQTSQIRAIYAAVSAVPFSLLHHLSHHPQRDRQLEVDAGGVVHSHTGGHLAVRRCFLDGAAGKLYFLKSIRRQSLRICAYFPLFRAIYPQRQKSAAAL